MNVCSLQVVPLRTKTYAAPTQMFAPRPGGASSAHPGGSMPGVRQASSPAPTAIVFPSSLMEREKPNPSLGSLFDPLMNACWLQVPFWRVNTNSAPDWPNLLSCGGLTPRPELLSLNAAAPSVLPSKLSPTEKPKRSPASLVAGLT